MALLEEGSGGRLQTKSHVHSGVWRANSFGLSRPSSGAVSLEKPRGLPTPLFFFPGESGVSFLSWLASELVPVGPSSISLCIFGAVTGPVGQSRGWADADGIVGGTDWELTHYKRQILGRTVWKPGEGPWFCLQPASISSYTLDSIPSSLHPAFTTEHPPQQP